MTIRIFTAELSHGEVELVEIVDELGNAVQMPKSVWEELQAQQTEGGLK